LSNDEKEPLRERFRVVSLDVDRLTHQASVDRVLRLARFKGGGYVCFATVHMVMEALDSPEFAATVNAAEIVVPDGMPMVWMQRLQSAKDPQRIRANDLMMMLMQAAEKENLKVGFYGGTREVIDAIVARARKEHPGLNIAYAYSPPFRELTPEEDAEFVDQISTSGTQILFVGLGCPKQEVWMAQHSGRVHCAMLGVGASFDFYAGKIKESPAWLGRLGLEWLYRLSREPKRLWRRYLILNPRFIWQAGRQLLNRNRAPPGV